jgi:hypothetical protein
VFEHRIFPSKALNKTPPELNRVKKGEKERPGKE